MFKNSKSSLKNHFGAASLAIAAAATSSLAQTPTSPDAQYSCIVLASDGATNPAAAYFNREGLTVVITRYAWNLELAGPAGDQHVIIQAGHDANVGGTPPEFIQTHLKVEGAVTGSNTEIHSGAFVLSTASTNTTYHVQETDWSDGRVQQAPLNTWDEHATFSVTPSGQNLDWSDLGANQSFRLATGSGEPEADSIGSVSYTPTTRIVNLGLDGAHIYTVIESNGHQTEMLTATIETFGLIDPNGDNAQDCNCPGSAGTLGKCEIECGCVDGISSDDCTAQGGSWTASTTCAGGGSTTFCDDDTPVDPTLRDGIIYMDGDVDPLDMLCAGGDEPGGGWPTYYFNGMTAVAPAPIQQTTGQKIETATDLIVDLTGTDFRLTRRYTSVGESSNGLLGNAWAMGLFSFLGVDSSGASPVLTLKAPQGFAQFEENDPDVWTTGGPTDQTFTMEVADFDDGSAGYPVWRLTEPGGWQTDFHRAAETGDSVASTLPDSSLHGFPYQRIDMMGNRWSFYYATVGGTLSNGGQVRLSSIVCERHASDGDFEVEARISFSWHESSGEGAFGRLRAVQVARPDSSQTSNWYTTHKVAYQYYDDLLLEGNLPADIDHLGTSGDLIQVTTSERLDNDGATEVYRDRITQYRYHDGSRFGGTAEAVDTDSDGDGIPGEQGEAHQIKMVINPFEVEYFAQHYRDGSDAFSLAEAAQRLHKLDGNDTAFTVDTLGDDGETVLTTVKVVRLASKVIARYDTSDRVLVQYLQASCGCGGYLNGTLGVRRGYTYGYHEDTVSGLEYFRFTLTESSNSDPSGAFDDYRIYRTHHRTQTAGGVPRLYIESIEDAGMAATTWAKAYDYTAGGELKAVINTSAISSYSPSGESNPSSPAAAINLGSYAPKTGSGYVMGYEYDADSRLEAVYFRAGYNDTVAFTDASWEKIESFARTDTTRDDLITEHIRYRVAGSTNPNEQEVTTYSYRFWSPQSGTELAGQFSGHIVAYKKTSVERELTTENGPGPGTYDTEEIFDVNGRVVLHRAADGSMTEYFYSGESEQLTKIVRNQQTATWTAPASGTNGFSIVGGSGTLTLSGRADGGTLTTEYKLDQLGRTIESIAPGGITTYTYRTMSNPPSRDDNPNLLYYSRISLPHPISASGVNYDAFASIATQTWMDAANLTAEIRGYEMPSSVAKADYRANAQAHINAAATAGLIASRSTMNIDWSSKSIEQRVWHDASDDDASYLSQAQFDEYGRTLWNKDAVGNFTEYTYDVLDRMTSILVGTNRTASNNMVAIAAYYYDGSEPSGPSLVGDSNLTQTVRPIDGSSANDRITSWHYDNRNRVVFQENHLPPHKYNVYDNLSRPVEQHKVSELTQSDLDTRSQTDLTKRIHSTRMFYSQRGLTYRSGVEIDPTTVPHDDLLSNSAWFDEAGRKVKSQAPNAAATKVAFDGLGRTTHRFVGEMFTDSSFADVYDLTSQQPKLAGNRILRETVTEYVLLNTVRGFGEAQSVTTYLRSHDSVSTGPLSDFGGSGGDSTAVATYSINLFDEASRLVKRAFYGTNVSAGFATGGLAPTPPPNNFDLGSSVPAFSGQPLVTETVYDPRGRVHVTIAADSTRTRTIFDDLDRRVATVENDQGGLTLSWSTPDFRWTITGASTSSDEDRATSFVYDGASNVVKRVAHIGPSSVQETEYDYGYEGTDISSNLLLAEVTFPNESTGLVGTGPSYTVSYEYNRLGERKQSTDQNGTIHTYSRDGLGRITLDAATTLGYTELDDAIRAIQYTYSASTGFLETVRSLDDSDATSANVVNEIRYEYDGLLALSSMRQNPTGEVGSGNSADVVYSYSRLATTAAGRSHSRLDQLRYPLINAGALQRTELTQTYGASGSLDDKISRSTGFDWTYQSASSTTHSVEYSYVGLGKAAVAEYSSGGIVQDRHIDPDFSGSGSVSGEYAGYDQFGRMKRQVWGESGWNPAAKPALLDIGYDLNSNGDIERRLDSRQGASLPDRGDEFSYDGLHRLVDSDRGAPSGSGAWVQNGGQGEAWVLDVLGNPVEYDREIDGLRIERMQTFNAANELTENSQILTPIPGSPGPSSDLDMSYDAAGNLRFRMVTDDVRWVYIWDAWNRLVGINIEENGKSGWQHLAFRLESSYYGQNQRAWSRLDSGAAGYPSHSAVPSNQLDRMELFYYDSSWRLLERRVDETWNGTTFAHDSTTQWIWGERYVDELVAFSDDANRDDRFESVHYAMTDRNFSVIGLTNGERIRYDAYGQSKVSPAGDVDADGSVDLVDQNAVLGAFGAGISDPPPSSYIVEADLDASGSVNLQDLNTVTANFGTSVARGKLSASGNVIGFAGYVFEPASGMYLARNRWYLQDVGRWISRDPLGYADGQSGYQYTRGRPLVLTDPFGLSAVKPEYEIRPSCGEEGTEAIRECMASSSNVRLAMNLYQSSCFGTDAHVSPRGPLIIDCKPLEKTVAGYYTCKTNTIELNNSKVDDYCSILAHEILHAADYCVIHPNQEWCPGRHTFYMCRAIACTEARAAGHLDCCDRGSLPFRHRDRKTFQNNYQECMGTAKRLYRTAYAGNREKICWYHREQFDKAWEDCAPKDAQEGCAPGIMCDGYRASKPYVPPKG